MNQLLIVVLMAIFVNVNGNMKKKKSPPQKNCKFHARPVLQEAFTAQ